MPTTTSESRAPHRSQRTDDRRQENPDLALAERIRERILSRLGTRIHDLAVRVDGSQVVLNGRSATYYSKQVAQHAALGAIDDQQIENAITVDPFPR